MRKAFPILGSVTRINTYKSVAAGKRKYVTLEIVQNVRNLEINHTLEDVEIFRCCGMKRVQQGLPLAHVRESGGVRLPCQWLAD